MNILFIIESFSKIDEPTSKIAYKFALSLTNSNNIYILTNDYKNGFMEGNSNINIFPCGIKLNFFLKICRRFFSLIFPKDLFPYQFIKRKAKKIIDNNKVDIIVSFSGSFWTQKVGAYLCYKHKKRYIGFYTDPFSCEKTNLKNRRPISFLKRIEKKWLVRAHCIAMPSNYLIKYKTLYPDFIHKFRKIELPCFIDELKCELLDGALPTNTFLYAGSLDQKIRDSSKLIEFALYLRKHQKKYRITVLSEKTHSLPNDLINYAPRKSGQEYLSYVMSSTALLIIDNNRGIQIPSKVFEYISTGKPIICFYKNKNSLAIDLLRQYDNAFLIDTNSNDNIFDDAIKFVENAEIVSKNIINERFKEFTSDYIIKEFKKVLGL